MKILEYESKSGGYGFLPVSMVKNVFKRYLGENDDEGTTIIKTTDNEEIEVDDPVKTLQARFESL